MKHEVLICDHQSAAPVPHAWLVGLERAGTRAAREIARQHALSAEAPLHALEEVEVALVDDATSDRVHRDFMGIEGATDVITFEHGEIVIGVEVAKRQAAEYGEPELRELLRYLVHGLLHLAGHEDEEDAERQRMEEIQETLVKGLWPDLAELG
ncbi:MAG: rRNA maturation RNase YbeY [Akkermansiaceae bacterium]|nr:rRNA maturation RNase YbeY [Akkermansiaceae bacterium]